MPPPSLDPTDTWRSGGRRVSGVDLPHKIAVPLDKAPWLILDHEFRPATEHTRTGLGEAGRLSARIGTPAQRKQIGQTERCLDMQVIVELKPHADCECRRGKALQRLSRRYVSNPIFLDREADYIANLLSRTAGHPDGRLR